MTALRSRQDALGADFTALAGHAVPARYAQGVAAEHRAVRTHAGLIDLSHLAQFEVTGPDRNAFVNRVACNDVGALGSGDAQFSALLTDAGTFLDEIVILRFPDALLLVVNAENAAHAWTHLIEQKQKGANVRLRDVSAETGHLGLEGPEAAQVLEPLADVAVREMRFRTVRPAVVAGVDVFLARSGYSGEDGFELLCRERHTPALWDALVAAGATPFGLDARDLLRLEMGYVAWGKELDGEVTPAEAGIGWIVKLGKGAPFVGHDALRAERRRGITRSLVGFVTEPAAATIAEGDAVRVRGRIVDRVRSAAMSPSVGRTIGLTYLPVAYAEPGMAFEIVRGETAVPAAVAARPFYANGSRRASS